MRDAPQAGLDAAGDDGDSLERLARPLAIGERRPVGPAADLPGGAVGVVVAHFAIGRVMVDHRVHIAGADREEEPRPAKLAPWLARSPVGLTQNPHAMPFALQQPPQQRHRETRMIDVSIARHEHDIDGIPPAGFHFSPTHWQRRRGSKRGRLLCGRVRARGQRRLAENRQQVRGSDVGGGG